MKSTDSPVLGSLEDIVAERERWRVHDLRMADYDKRIWSAVALFIGLVLGFFLGVLL